MSSFKTEYGDKIKIIDDYMQKRFEGFRGCEDELLDAMEYAVFGGGKRIRSVLCTETARMLTGSADKALPFAAAIEFIHAFSLVHDDLPCMDNDDMRRGKPSCHKKYGEALALLAGDALLSTACEVMLSECESGGAPAIRAARYAMRSAGINGMINGQVRDIKLTEQGGADLGSLTALIEQKTMALFEAGIICAALACGADDATIGELEKFAYSLGMAFQIRDDFEDEAQDSADAHDSPNFINTLGRAAAEEKMRFYVEKARAVIDKFDNSEFIKELITYLFD